MKIDPIERLAREICWAEFSPEYRNQMGVTQAAYWSTVSEIKKAEYRRDARFLAVAMKRLPKPLIAGLVAGAYA